MSWPQTWRDCRLGPVNDFDAGSKVTPCSPWNVASDPTLTLAPVSILNVTGDPFTETVASQGLSPE